MIKTIRVSRWGNGLGIRLPKEFAERASIDETSCVEVREVSDGLLIAPTKEPRRRMTLAERFRGYNGDYRGETIDWGTDVGGEVCD
jgi:antitoxin MazE